jgi:alpha-L-fucosidase
MHRNQKLINRMKTIKTFLLSLIIIGVAGKFSVHAQKYQPDFESLEKYNPVPEWFKDAKFGIYFHWGVYSVPAFANEW